MAKRFETFRLDKSKVTQQGFLKADALFTRTGIFLYKRNDGRLIRELRPPEEVFKAESIESLHHAPITDDHPTEFVTPENAKDLTIGWLGDNIRPDGSYVKGSVVISDSKAQLKISAGKREFSCGYECDVEESPGVWEGQKYDTIQRNIVYNHVALVDKGRAGPMARLKLDAADAELIDGNENKETKEMKKIVIDGKEFEVSEEVAAAFEAFSKKKDSDLSSESEKARKALEEKAAIETELATKMEASTKAAEEVQAKLDAANEELKKRADSISDEALQKAVDSRIEVLKTASYVLGSEEKFDGKSNLVIMKSVIAKRNPKTDLAEKNEAYVQARFDQICEDLAEEIENTAKLGIKLSKVNDGEKMDSATAAANARKEALDAWKQPLQTSKK